MDGNPQPVETQSVEAYLADHDELVWKVEGTSMLPAIRPGRDLVVLRRPEPSEELHPLDVVLFRYAGKLRLHRIVAVRGTGASAVYDVRGDNATDLERDVSRADIIGVLRAIVRNGRRIDAGSAAYRLYSQLWQAISPVTVGAHRLWRIIKAARR